MSEPLLIILVPEWGQSAFTFHCAAILEVESMNGYFTWVIFSTIIWITGCLRLDDQLYNNDNSIDAYLFDGYIGTTDF